MDLNWGSLTAEQKAEFMREAEAERKREAELRDSERIRYKQMAEASVDELFVKIEKANSYLAMLKKEVYDTLNALVDIKKEIYATSQKNKSHTFSNADGTRSITIGVRNIEGWDGTEVEGVERINDYLSQKVADPEITEILAELLKKDKHGELNKHRVMSLAKLKERVHDPKFQEGVDIILAAYKPQSTSVFVEAKHRQGATMKWSPVSLDFASIQFE